VEITGVYTIYFFINSSQMEAPFIVTLEASTNIFGMNLIKKYKMKMDFLTITVCDLGIFSFAYTSHLVTFVLVR
jgi:hypothetical protein